MKKKVWYGVGIFLLVIGLAFATIFGQRYSWNIGQENKEIFNSADINSRITAVGIKYKGSYMELSDGRSFAFYPYTDKKLNDGRIFIVPL